MQQPDNKQVPDTLRPTLATTHGSPVLKRLFDLAAVLAGLWLIWPLLVAIALWIKLDSPGPVFFRQLRVGRKGQLFHIHKFRTMQMNAEVAGQLTVGADSRVTRAGRILRKTKLDELPQLLDVLFGDMSLVGAASGSAKVCGVLSGRGERHCAVGTPRYYRLGVDPHDRRERDSG